MMYDYIIAGAGSAGCVLASRLTEDPETSVLLLEAGGNDDLPAIHDPVAAATLRRSAVDWAYSTEEEPHLNNRKIPVPRGKVLGGSSSINFMVYVRGNRADYDQWQALGNQGWSYADVLPYFKKIESYAGGDSDYHGRGGPLDITDLPSINPLTAAFIEAGGELGWPRNDDYNGALQDGFGTFQLTIGQGKRQSTAVGYLHPVQSRPNLTVWTQTLVTRVLFEGTRAVGVAYLKDRQEQQIRVNKEVILSGGTINSPQVLMLSGIGPADQLQALDIPVVADVPGVGHHLQDHLGIEVYFKAKPSFTQLGTILEGVAFVKTQPDLSEPDIELMLSPFFLFPMASGNGYAVSTSLITSQSQGHVTLHSTDPTKPPAIYANYLAHETDQQKLINGIKLARRLSQTPSLAHFTDVEVLPGSQAQSDREILEYVRENARTISHFTGSCKMGHDDLAVVDEQLRVHGVEGLRVVDASIMPTTVRGNTNGPVIMIAERGADLIREQIMKESI
jgi:choline dehydrogenase